MSNTKFRHTLFIDENKEDFHLSEIPDLTALAVHQVIDGELNLENALAAQTDIHFIDQPVSPQNIVLKRLTLAQKHKAYLEMQIKNGSILAFDYEGSVPLTCATEDMPNQKALFKYYALQRNEFIKFANSLFIDVIVGEREVFTKPTSRVEATAMRDKQLQIEAEKMVAEKGFTRRKIAGILATDSRFGEVSAGRVERILKMKDVKK